MLFRSTVSERNSGVGAVCGDGVGVWATLCGDSAATNTRAHNACKSLIGVMYFMIVSFFLGKRVSRNDMIQHWEGNSRRDARAEPLFGLDRYRVPSHWVDHVDLWDDVGRMLYQPRTTIKNFAVDLLRAMQQ